MKQVKIIALTIENFKGLNFNLKTAGDVNVLGDNATGKTTIADAIHWALFDKNSQDKKDFAIKTIREDGEEQHNAEHSVELTLLVDGVETKLKKTFREKWTKKRGAATAEFGGHETKYWINEVPSKKGEYTTAVSDVIDESTFKLLTNPLYFSETVKWEDRRSLLLEIAGDVTDQDVINSDKTLTGLFEKLEGRTFEQFKKITTEKKKDINSELKEIPVRISELQKQLSFAADTTPLKERIAELEKEIDTLNETASNIKNGGAIAQKKAEIAELRAKVVTYQSDFKARQNEGLYSIEVRLQEERSNLLNLKSPIAQLQNKIQNNQSSIKNAHARIASLEAEIQSKRDEYNVENAKTFDKTECSCPTCKQDLPAEQVEEAVKTFNLNKSNKLQQISHTGKQIGGELDRLRNEIVDFENHIKEATAQLEEQQKVIDKKQTEIEKLESQISDTKAKTAALEDDEQYKQLVAKGEALKEEIQQLESHANEALQDVESQKQALINERSQLNAEVAKTANKDVIEGRINELATREGELAKMFAKIEETLFQGETFTRKKVEMLQEKINSKFKYVTFKLFENQVNGGLAETCETLVNGVPFSKGLNNAARINAGIDIINTLSAHYNVSATIIIDNAEAVTKLIDTDAQVIRLIVSAADKSLRVEQNQKQLTEVI
ncbi:hypothetical protein [Kurthia senegalensis]|uniref:hypothetical protein n=1 Tax=Kurthia senegalensis TaxID=1033740 RepID=UPI00028A2943|nr:hypothetical protein [Kurthia senegalensis]